MTTTLEMYREHMALLIQQMEKRERAVLERYEIEMNLAAGWASINAEYSNDRFENFMSSWDLEINSKSNCKRFGNKDDWIDKMFNGFVSIDTRSDIQFDEKQRWDCLLRVELTHLLQHTELS